MQCISSGALLARLGNSHAEDAHNDHSTAIDNHSRASNKTNLESLNATTTEDHNQSNRTASPTSLNSIKSNLFLKQNDFWNICPILLYQLAQPLNSLEHSGCLDPAAIPEHAHHHMYDDEEENRTLGTLICYIKRFSSITYDVQFNAWTASSTITNNN